jgi:hypothetical protein
VTGVQTCALPISGLLYDRWKDCYGKGDDRTLVIQASSMQLNPLIDPAEVEADREKDPLAAKSEWDGIWRDDVSAYVPLAVLEDAVDEGVTHRPPRRGVRYHGYVDQSGGAGSDSMVLAISHYEDGFHVLDLVIEKRPQFSASDAVQEFCAACKGYRITTVYGDLYGGGTFPDMFAKHNVRFLDIGMVKSDVYHAVLPHLTSYTVRLLDDKRHIAQFANLEARTVRGGRRPIIDHPKRANAHDDVANAIAGALMLCADVKKRGLQISNETLRRIGINDGEQRRLGIPVAPVETYYWPGGGQGPCGPETAAERSARQERLARNYKRIDLDDDSDEPLPSVPILSSRGGR